ncbi:asparagine synthase (glutamine-hydrolyzing) [Desulfatitalea alkaliphila]|uniref:asparagine synthase (glutamine-hydrolyzing) n=1 Tax=Desulfatitalea alkaliphila TaxID=2929485 RepID=A0AA41UJM5_9BACT|nr:asparagine synthase (glutamine-hydrolyzing) [Desulfatitalea alkaliphila]MCJ8502110.1 asparagine synthase (glutamine-hydrolyzing) [Desulfatitalea alkaliphila]
MCGISGILNLTPNQQPPTPNQLTSMVSAIRHRGPDESGIYLDDRIGLGHARLSIIGLQGGGQPIGNEDGTLWIIYNGEVFNYIELKPDLLAKGHRFTTDTDTEVLLHLYEEYGPACLEKINGQFSLAIWDNRKKELFLARDRVGIRPFFYTQCNNQLLFASEIKALLTHPQVPRAIDPKALHQIFTFWTTLREGTLFENIHELPPGHYMTVKGGRIDCRAFWTIPYYAPDQRWQGTLPEAGEALRELLLDAVRLRLRADVPVGAYLSGGLDSSLITALISRNFNNQLKTFSIGFQEGDFDESSYQRQMIAHLGTDHQQTLATNQLIRENFPDVIYHCEKPILRTAPVPLYLLSRLVRDNNFKVVLTGEGADEVFGGYNIFKEAKIRSFWAKQPRSTQRPRLLQKLYPYIFKNASRGSAFLYAFYAVKPGDLEDPCFSHRIRWNNTGKNTGFFSNDLAAALSGYAPDEQALANLPPNFSTRDTLSRAQYLEMDIFLSNYLLSSQGDRPAMAHSLEIRLPFLDYRVIDFAARMPPHWKINGLNEKYILKKSFQGLIPDTVRTRPKQPYRAPIQEVFFNPGPSDYVDALLSEENLKKTNLFDPLKVTRLLHKYRNGGHGSEVQNMAVVGILSTQLAHHHFIANTPTPNTQHITPNKIIQKQP